MTGRAHRLFIILASILPPVAIVVAAAVGWNHVVHVRELVLLAVFYTLCGLGISTGFHRLLTHRAFDTHRPIRLALAVLGTAAAEGPPIIWVSHHRRHHTLADQEGDPHSPHVGHGSGLRGALKGLWHAHWGWLFDDQLTSTPLRYAPDLVRDPAMRWISQHFLGIAVAGLLLPGLIDLALTRTFAGFLEGVLWGGLIRMFLLHHATYAVNSVGHVAGRRRFTTGDESRNVAWLSIPSMGEAWHNNHHAFPTSFRHGMKWWEIDLSAAFIATLERTGLAWEVVRVEPGRVAAKLRVDGSVRPTVAGAAGDGATAAAGAAGAQTAASAAEAESRVAVPR
jgi:stearoyl-CoA desaturase (delta-9 desaturase)